MATQCCIILLIFLLLTSCQRNHISVQTHYVTRTDLASFYIGTPDPQLDYPLLEQQLTIEWSFPSSYFNYSDLQMQVTIRFKDRSEQVRNVAVRDGCGCYTYYLIGEEFCKRKGILTYKVDVYGDGQLIETWKHKLWVELINLNK